VVKLINLLYNSKYNLYKFLYVYYKKNQYQSILIFVFMNFIYLLT